MYRRRLLILLIAVTVLNLDIAPLAADSPRPTPIDERHLAEKFAPILYFHADELFRPQAVDVLVDNARLRQIQNPWLVTNVRNEIAIADLARFRSEDYALDAWLGDEGSSDFKNYSAHRAAYQKNMSPSAGGPPIVSYVHVIHQQEVERIVLQYWLFYYYNDWFNKHEGDWEMVQVILTEDTQPEWVVLSQHHGGTRRRWQDVIVEKDSHPAVFVALGSHANYFYGPEIYPNGKTIGNEQAEIMDRTGTAVALRPEVQLIPNREDVATKPQEWMGFEWLLFRGHWGEAAPQADFGGPLGPADKGELWENPYQWGVKQPLDSQTWYENRLRVQVQGSEVSNAQVSLQLADGQALADAESLDWLALLHRDPAPGEDIIAQIHVDSDAPVTVAAVWPDVDSSTVMRYEFAGVPAGEGTLHLAGDRSPTLTIAGSSQQVTGSKETAATWDVPDVVWAAGLLPASEVLIGIGIILLAIYIPTLFYVTILYHSDRYEKEPKKLLLTAFLWGAWPAVIIAFGVRVFLQLPVDMLGRDVMEAAQAGILSPFIEELIKGAVVLLIAVRYRREFDGILDGIIYGAVVGLGFAMTANMISYAGSFLLYGFEVLRRSILFEGLLYGLNQGFYTAIFGAGLGYARLTTKKRQRWLVPLAAFGLAVAVHSIHNFVVRDTEGFNIFTISLNWGGVLAMFMLITWSVRLEKNTMEKELIGEVPDEVYFRLITHGGRRRAQWQGLRNGGLRGLRDVRRVHKVSAELALKKMQFRLRPNEIQMRDEADRLRAELQTLLHEA